MASDVFMGGSEVYVAAANAEGGQAFFDDIASHKIAAVYGFHYGFAGFNGDPAYVQTAYAVEQPLNPCTSLYYVLDGRVDVAVVPELYPEMFLQNYPQYQGRFLTGLEPDQTYEHSIVLREDGTVSLDEINALLAELEENGPFGRIMEPYLF
ncbi:MAG: hypothetical protein HOI34_00620 [Rhodospirillaceae bacterium]|nr:hypothetical protein [Rhodospirillaceae bacterium]MBT6509855.1 hypothetical protein [Rhodospirillaceae bacterium]MBT7648513.1 hypothetical protein [Rhodospirillaceae bacterium]